MFTTDAIMASRLIIFENLLYGFSEAEYQYCNDLGFAQIRLLAK